MEIAGATNMREKARPLVSASLMLVVLVIGCSTFAQNAQLTKIGMTPGRARSVAWLGDARFAVGRWDGTLAIFRRPQNRESGPVMLQDAATPSLQGIQMINRPFFYGLCHFQ